MFLSECLVIYQFTNNLEIILALLQKLISTATALLDLLLCKCQQVACQVALYPGVSEEKNIF